MRATHTLIAVAVVCAVVFGVANLFVMRPRAAPAPAPVGGKPLNLHPNWADYKPPTDDGAPLTGAPQDGEIEDAKHRPKDALGDVARPAWDEQYCAAVKAAAYSRGTSVALVYLGDDLPATAAAVAAIMKSGLFSDATQAIPGMLEGTDNALRRACKAASAEACFAIDLRGAEGYSRAPKGGCCLPGLLRIFLRGHPQGALCRATTAFQKTCNIKEGAFMWRDGGSGGADTIISCGGGEFESAVTNPKDEYCPRVMLPGCRSVMLAKAIPNSVIASQKFPFVAAAMQRFYAEHSVRTAVDGNEATDWIPQECSLDTRSHMGSCELAEASHYGVDSLDKKANGVRVHFGHHPSVQKTFRLEISDDGATWVPAGKYATLCRGSNCNYTLPDVAAPRNCFRFVSTESSTPTFMIFEIAPIFATTKRNE